MMIGMPPARSIAVVYVEGKIAASIVHFAKFDSLIQQVTPISGLAESRCMPFWKCLQT